MNSVLPCWSGGSIAGKRPAPNARSPSALQALWHLMPDVPAAGQGTGPGRDRSWWRCGRAVRPRDLDASQQGHPATRHPGIALAGRYAAAELKAWLTEASSCDITAVQTFVAGLEQDGAAVRAALTLPWSSGQAEGRIDRLKPLKRQMYGRASLDLLRRRTLLAA
ncbi:transposase (plasmid) [Azospirillum brasilense]|nr:transposase [Azospirillum brasilense]